MSKFLVIDKTKEDFFGKIGTSPLDKAGLMTPLSFGSEEMFVFFPWEIEEVQE